MEEYGNRENKYESTTEQELAGAAAQAHTRWQHFCVK